MPDNQTIDAILSSYGISGLAGGGGFSLDTAVRGPSIFNYRLHLGFDAQGLYDDDDRYVFLGGVVLDVVGLAWTERMARTAERAA